MTDEETCLRRLLKLLLAIPHL